MEIFNLIFHLNLLANKYLDGSNYVLNNIGQPGLKILTWHTV